MFKGIAGSEGIGIGKVAMIKEQDLTYEPKSKLSVQDETARFEQAVQEFTQRTEKMAEEMRNNVGDKESEILMGHVLMISDPAMTDEVKEGISGGLTSEAATEQVFEGFASMFGATGDELTVQRAADLRDIKTRLIKTLLGVEEVNISALPAGSVIVARDLTPSMTAGIIRENISGIITEVGGRTSHSAILARALEIPAVLSIDNITKELIDGEVVIVDGTDGSVIASPGSEEVEKYRELKKRFDDEKKELLKLAGKPTVTADGRRVELLCNIGKPDDCALVIERDGEGVGLFRTEFLYMDSKEQPGEEQQFEAYKKAAMTLKGKPVTIRTLDVGGDKDIPYLGLEKEDNPFMGFRAVRYCIKNQDLYKTQLRALMRASAFGDIRIMIPLVTCVEEVRAVKKLVAEIASELDQNGVAYNKDIKVGVMMETPAAAVIADLLAKEADFFSIGTNDLTGYTMAADRGNANVAYLYSAYNPAVLRNIKSIIYCGRAEGIEVGMCGEAASDPLLIPLLVAFGLEEYSVNPVSVLSTRNEISKWSVKDAQKVAEEAMACSTEEEVRNILTKYRR